MNSANCLTFLQAIEFKGVKDVIHLEQQMATDLP